MSDLIFGLFIFLIIVGIGIEIVLLYLLHKITETNEWVADIEIKKDKEIYELRRRVAILEKAQEGEIT